MTGGEIKKLRERLGWSQQQLADVLNGALDRKYSTASVSAWETSKRGTPDHVAAFVDTIALEQFGQSSDSAQGTPLDPNPPGADTAPAGVGDDTPPAPQVPFTNTGNAHERVCKELFEMIGTGISLTGAAIGSEKLTLDGQIIDGDAEALGRAYGKLAETNATFRQLLVGMTSTGAWFEVTMVTGVVVTKIARNHQTPPGELVHFPGPTGSEPPNVQRDAAPHVT